MIVKDEAHVIVRCLNSVRPLIDYVLVEDTGSTDGTQRLIQDWLAMTGLPGEVIEVPWQNFAFNRSHALALLRRRDEIDYALIIDADDTVVFEPGFDVAAFKKSMTADAYHVVFNPADTTYRRLQICSNRHEFEYRGVLHEYLAMPAGAGLPENAVGFHMNSSREGARNRDPAKYLKDVQLLQIALQHEQDPFLRSRYTFYLAQSYRDCGEHKKALEAYLARAELGFWQEEVFVSLYQAANLKELMGYPDQEIIDAYLRAAAARPTRAEALHGAARLCRNKGRNEEGFLIARRGLALAAPTDGLFVEPWIYTYGLRDEFAVNAFWAGHHRECLDVCLQLLEGNTLPDTYRDRIVQNARFALDKLDKQPIASLTDMLIWPAGSPSPRIPLATPHVRTPPTGLGMVSVITPTHCRPQSLKNALVYFRNQDYEDIEWLILDDSPQANDEFSGLDDRNIFYQHVDKKYSIGEKRNILIERARGKFIVQFDDDDYYAPGYVSTMIAVLTERGADLLNLRGWFLYDLRSQFFGYWDLTQKEGPHYRCDSAGVALTTFDQQTIRELENNHLGYGFSYAFKKQVWESVKFPHIDWNEDSEFVGNARSRFKIDGIHDTTGLSLHFLHPASTSRCFPQHHLPGFLIQTLFPGLNWPTLIGATWENGSPGSQSSSRLISPRAAPQEPPRSESISFTNNWFDITARGIWDTMIPALDPRRILEIGSYEGASACYLIANCASKAPIEIHCIDSWEGGIEHKESAVDMTTVEQRFLNNTRLARNAVSHQVDLVVHKGYSQVRLARLIGQNFLNHFDLIYIDGSHQAPDVLSDAVLSFQLLRVGGMMIFDDYLFREALPQHVDPLRCTKPAIDAFLNIYFRKMQLAWSPNSQVCARKVSD